jgi:hypothetical protein
VKPESKRQTQAKHFLQDYLELVRPIAEFDRIINGLSAASFRTSQAYDNDPAFLRQGLPANQSSQKNLKPVLGYKVHTCIKCLTNILLPVYYFDENREIFENEPLHNCYMGEPEADSNSHERTRKFEMLIDTSPKFLQIMLTAYPLQGLMAL